MAQGLGPGLKGWFAADEAARQQNAFQLQLYGMLQKQQQEQAYRSALSQAQTPDEQLAVATKFGGPEAVMRHADRTAQIKATKETALARITETARNTDSQIAHRLAQETDSKKRLELEAMRDAARNYYNKQSLALSGEKLFYETGTRLPVEPAPLAAPQQGVLRTTAPNDAQALQLVQDADRQGLGASVGVTGSPMMPQAAPVAAPQPVTPYQPQDPNAGAEDRLIAAQARAGVPAPIPSAAVTEQKQITLADAPAGLTPKGKQQWLLQQTKPSIAGGGVLRPETLEFVAKQYLSGDRQAIQGFARNATARIAIQNAIVDEAAKRGMTPEQTAAQIAEFAGVVAGSRTVGQRAANISLAATEALEMIPIVKETSDKFSRTAFVPWNYALRAYESGTGTPEIAAFGASINALVNVYARAINPTGVPTVSDKEHARAVLNSVQSPAQVDAVLGIIRRELDIAKRAPGTVREATRAGITGEAPSAAPSALSDTDLINKYRNPGR